MQTLPKKVSMSICRYSRSVVSGVLLPNSPAQEKGDLWSNSVPKEVVEGMSNSDIIRQETIFELIKGEFKYVNELELIYEVVSIYSIIKN
jgi:hypothetical protein